MMEYVRMGARDDGFNPDNCFRSKCRTLNEKYWKATCRAIVGIHLGTLFYAMGAVFLGAPVGTIRNLKRTIYWSVLMSLFTVVHPACVFGTSWCDWRRVFTFTRKVEKRELVICMCGYGAVIGAWFGAWPMPLDWEQPWQEWPVCVGYGAIAGYLIGLIASFFLFPHPIKSD